MPTSSDILVTLSSAGVTSTGSKGLKRGILKQMTRSKTPQQIREAKRKRAVTMAKKIARLQAKYRCAYCGRGEPLYRTHGSHIFAESKNKNMSADVDNILCLCASHHAVMPGRIPPKEFNWHSYPAESITWFQDNYPSLWQALKERRWKKYKVNWDKKIEELKITLKQLEV